MFFAYPFDLLHWIFLLLLVLPCLYLLNKKKYIQPEGKAVVITGCDTGFGNATAKKLGELGFMVFAGCLTKEGQEELQVTAQNVHAFPLDVTNSESIERFSKAVLDQVDSVFCVINNAGVSAGSLVDWTTIEEYRYL